LDTSGASVPYPTTLQVLQYRFPSGPETMSYPYLDLNARATSPIDFVEESEVNGIPVYHFRQTIPVTSLHDVAPTATSKLTLPAAKWGLEGDGDVTMLRFYTNVRDVWVEPRTGAVLKGGEQLHLFYGRSANQVDVTALKTHLVFDEETIESQIAVTQDSLDKLDLFGKTLPIILGILAAILIIAGAVLGVMSAGGSTARRTYDPPTEQLRSTNL
ncbi:DUF3068 domain-containing protein, partial [Nocardia sp. NPDC058497]|uniref:DUF3068 domain-containing protein n=1 Tax=Nocardia sp. NPDC058497 TaxID=3346529 RepID=UPI00364655E5